MKLGGIENATRQLYLSPRNNIFVYSYSSGSRNAEVISTLENTEAVRFFLCHRVSDYLLSAQGNGMVLYRIRTEETFLVTASKQRLCIRNINIHSFLSILRRTPLSQNAQLPSSCRK